MFSYFITGGSTDNNCFSQKLELAFSPVDSAGDDIAGWTETYLDIFYLDTNTNGFSYLRRSSGTYYHDVSVPSISAEGNNVFGLKEDLSTTTITWLIQQRGRPLYFLFKNAINETSLKTKFYTGRVEFTNDIYNTLTDTTNARLLWLRNDIENVVFPRLKRLLQFAGENLLIDNFSYDNAGNITGLRIRGFDTTTNASAATVDNTSVETGEDLTLTVTQTHDLPRNVRSSHLSVMDSDATDVSATENNITSSTDAPGNTGNWPS